MTGSGLRIGIAGATGAVGGELLRLLAERDIPVATLRAFASVRSAGTTVRFGDDEVVVEELAEGALCKNGTPKCISSSVPGLVMGSGEYCVTYARRI